MPQRLRQAAKAALGEGQQKLGLRFDRAQYLYTALGIGMWVVKGTGVTCIFHGSKALAACNTSIDTAHEGLVLVAGERKPNALPRSLPVHFIALGIAPDWAKTVRLQIVDGAAKTVPVSHNAYAFQAQAPIDVVELRR